MLAEVMAPDQVAAQTAVGKRDHIHGLVGEEDEGHDEALVALAAGHRAFDETLAEEVENAVVGDARHLHPGVNAQQGTGGIFLEIRRAQIARSENRGRIRKRHAPARLKTAARGYEEKVAP
jgi:hypothetical protein